MGKNFLLLPKNDYEEDGCQEDDGVAQEYQEVVLSTRRKGGYRWINWSILIDWYIDRFFN